MTRDDPRLAPPRHPRQGSASPACRLFSLFCVRRSPTPSQAGLAADSLLLRWPNLSTVLVNTRIGCVLAQQRLSPTAQACYRYLPISPHISPYLAYRPGLRRPAPPAGRLVDELSRAEGPPH